MKELNTTLIYVLSSLSIICCCFAGLGIFLALPSFIIANKRLNEAQLNHHEYSPESLKAMSNAKTFAMVTLVINGLNFVYSLYSIATTDWDVFMEEYKKALEQYKQ